MRERPRRKKGTRMVASDRTVPAGGGRMLRVGPVELHVKAALETGHELLGCFQSRMPPGGGFPFPHLHDEYEEVFYVLEGEIEYLLGDRWTAAPVGTTISVPRGVVHAFRNSTHTAAGHLVVHAPAAALQMIEELGQAPREEWAAILERHHSRFAAPEPERTTR